MASLAVPALQVQRLEGLPIAEVLSGTTAGEVPPLKEQEAAAPER